MPVIINGSTGISGTDGSAGAPALQGTDANTGMFFPAADQIAFAEGGVEAMRLDASGNVGVGTTTPGYRLVVSSNGGTDATFISATGGAAYVGAVGAKPLVFETNGSERARINSGGQLFTTIDGTSSVMADYGCRAWVNFNGTGTVAIRGSGNVSSITDNGVGNYTVNFSTAMPDVNYVTTLTSGSGTPGVGDTAGGERLYAPTTSSQQFGCVNEQGTAFNDPDRVSVAIFR